MREKINRKFVNNVPDLLSLGKITKKVIKTLKLITDNININIVGIPKNSVIILLSIAVLYDGIAYASNVPKIQEAAMKQQTKKMKEAIQFATHAHQGAVRKGTGIPYIVHPIETMELVASMTDDEDVIVAAVLHDVVEDTACTLDEIQQHFGKRVASLVSLESEDKREGQNKTATWKIRKQEALEREKTAPREAKMIMLADKVSNMRSSLQDFRKEGDHIWAKFNMKDKKEQEWYYRSVADVLVELKDETIYQEYLEMLEEVFG